MIHKNWIFTGVVASFLVAGCQDQETSQHPGENNEPLEKSSEYHEIGLPYNGTYVGKGISSHVVDSNSLLINPAIPMGQLSGSTNRMNSGAPNEEYSLTGKAAATGSIVTSGNKIR